jgi:hypothetical protein
MADVQSNAEILLFAVPMIVAVFAGLFRIDTLFCQPRKRASLGRQFSDVDEHGRGACVEPDGIFHRIGKQPAGSRSSNKSRMTTLR